MANDKLPRIVSGRQNIGGPALLTKKKAEKDAKAIRDFWSARGHEVTVRVVCLSGADPTGLTFSVMSNLKNGLPPSLVKIPKRKPRT